MEVSITSGRLTAAGVRLDAAPQLFAVQIGHLHVENSHVSKGVALAGSGRAAFRAASFPPAASWKVQPQLLRWAAEHQPVGGVVIYDQKASGRGWIPGSSTVARWLPSGCLSKNTVK
jgi:hypothetical protein